MRATTIWYYLVKWKTKRHICANSLEFAKLACLITSWIGVTTCGCQGGEDSALPLKAPQNVH